MLAAILLLLTVLSPTESYTIAQETKLHTDLFTGYQKAIRPGADRSKPLSIYVDFLMISLKEFNEEEGRLSVIGAFKFVWTDNRLAWDKNSYGGDLTQTSVLQDTVWVPNVVNLNCFETMKPLGSSSLSLRMYDGGTVAWIPPALIESSCDADVTYYPFDSQTCVIRYYMPGYYQSDVNFSPSRTEADLQQYEQNNLWEITSTSLSTFVNSYHFQELQIELQMQRRSRYYIAGLILPICLMSFLQIMVFVLPEESGERVGFSVTVLLAVAVFLTIIQESLPEASEPSVSLLAYKLLVDILVGAMITSTTIIGSAIYHKNETDSVPICIKRCVQTCRCKLSCRKASPKVIDVKRAEKPPPDDFWDEAEDDVISWRDAGKVFDKCCLIFFTLCLLINNMVLMAIISLN